MTEKVKGVQVQSEEARSPKEEAREPPTGNSVVGTEPGPRHRGTGTGPSPPGETRPAAMSVDDAVGLQGQTSGHAQAASQGKPARKAHSLIDKVYHWDNLYRAWRKVRANKGAHGLDRITIRMFEADWQTHLREIQRKLMQNRFEPCPVRRVYIPKVTDPKQVRPLGIPVVADRIVQQALLQVLAPLFDPQMSHRSFGFRPGRNAHHAIATVIRDAKDGCRYVVDADIASFFDRIDHGVVMSRVRARIADGPLLRLIEAFLKAGVHEGGIVTVPTEGTPQGGVISPWLSNLVLDDLDKALEAKGLRFVRYADDFVVLCSGPKEAKEALEFVRQLLGDLKLSLNEAKTRLTNFRQGFEFLGFRFRQFRLGVRGKSLERFRERVRSLTRRQQGRNVEAVIADLNSLLRGWAKYFGVAEVSELFRSLDSWIRMRIRAFRFKRKCHHDNWRLPTCYLARWGLLSLQMCRPARRLSYVCA